MADRVVSLAPSATNIIRSLGCEDRVVGATVHGDHDHPVIGGWLNPDLERIETLDPDVIVATDALQGEIVSQLRERGYEPLYLSPRTLDDVLRSIERLGRALDATGSAQAVVEEMRAEFDRLRTEPPETERPVVYCEEWSDPPMAAGNWVPELVEIAGGRYPFRSPGERSEEVEQATIERHQPEHVILHVCGMGESVDRGAVLDRDWSVPAIARGNVWVVDDRLLNQPAPSLVAGARRIQRHIAPEEDPSPTTGHARS